jgi:hypothetical protein
LVLCDAIFDAVTSLGLMSPDFGEAFNLVYDHRLDEQALTAALQDMKQRGLVTFSGHCEGLGGFVGLTALGGSLWERERHPVWDAYCTYSEGGAPESLEVQAVRREVAETFLQVGNESRLVETSGEPMLSEAASE